VRVAGGAGHFTKPHNMTTRSSRGLQTGVNGGFVERHQTLDPGRVAVLPCRGDDGGNGTGAN